MLRENIQKIRRALISPFGAVAAILLSLTTLLIIVLWIAAGLNDRVLRDSVSRTDQVAWNIFQLETDFLRLRLAAEAHLTSAEKPNVNVEESYQEFKKNFDLLYSRVNTFVTTALREIPDPEYVLLVEDLQNSINLWAHEFDGTPIDGWQQWNRFLTILENDAALIRGLVVEALRLIVQNEEAERQNNLQQWKEYRQWLIYITILATIAIGATLYIMRSLYVRVNTAETSISDLKLATRELHEMAVKDPLTGLLTRRALDELSIKFENQEALLIWLDIDDFKSVNDSWGHKAGDDLLQEISQTLVRCTPDDGYAFRLGGEEFGIIAPWLGQEQATKLSSLLCLEVSRTYISVGDRPIRRTASIGVARKRSDTSIELGLEAADEAMFVAKKSGKNQISISDQGQTELS